MRREKLGAKDTDGAVGGLENNRAWQSCWYDRADKIAGSLFKLHPLPQSIHGASLPL